MRQWILAAVATLFAAASDAASAQPLAEGIPNQLPTDTLPSKPATDWPFPKFGERVTAEQVAWAHNVWPRVLEACPGLVKYKRDLTASTTAVGYFVDDYFEDHSDALIAVFLVRDPPANRKVLQYFAQGHNCYFAMEYPSGAAVHPIKTPCESLCLDQPRTYDKDGLRIPLRR